MIFFIGSFVALTRQFFIISWKTYDRHFQSIFCARNEYNEGKKISNQSEKDREEKSISRFLSMVDFNEGHHLAEQKKSLKNHLVIERKKSMLLTQGRARKCARKPTPGKFYFDTTVRRLRG